jgi:Fur family ferric uptake transcriptional regulator
VDGLLAVEVAVSPVDKFREYLMTKGLRLTHERRLIVDEVFSDHEHFDANQLSERLSRGKPGHSVSRPTVYRALILLVEAGLLRKVARPNRREVFEHDYGYPEHDHLICNQCGNLIEFPADDVSRIVDDVAATHGFRVEGHRLEVYGLCSNCLRPRQRRHQKLDQI